MCDVVDGMLTGITERTYIVPHPDGAQYSEDGGQHFAVLLRGTAVSMNLWGFGASFLAELAARFPEYLLENLPHNPLTCEYYLPLVPSQLIQEGKACFHVLKTDAHWFGVTYQEDLPRVQAEIAALKAKGVYPEHL